MPGAGNIACASLPPDLFPSHLTKMELPEQPLQSHLCLPFCCVLGLEPPPASLPPDQAHRLFPLSSLLPSASSVWHRAGAQKAASHESAHPQPTLKSKCLTKQKPFPLDSADGSRGQGWDWGEMSEVPRAQSLGRPSPSGVCKCRTGTRESVPGHILHLSHLPQSRPCCLRQNLKLLPSSP